MKSTISIISLILFLIQNSFTQNSNTIYLDDEFEKVTKDEATYYRVFTAHPDGTKKLYVQTYYMSGQIQSGASCHDELCVQMDGYYVSYYENGNKKEEGERIKMSKKGVWNKWYENGQEKETAVFANGNKSGIWKTWYKNGQQKEYAETIGDFSAPLHLRTKMIDLWDYSGGQLVIQGNGKAIHYFEDTLVVSSKGEYKNGFKIGDWKGFTKENKPRYQEIYKKKKVSGISLDEDGNQYKYDELESRPEPYGGMSIFYQYIGKSMRYPNEARQLGVQGRVFVQFVVDKDGTLIDLKTVKGIGSGCDKEAERVIRKAQKWKPGKQRGKPVKVRMILPVTFRLS